MLYTPNCHLLLLIEQPLLIHCSSNLTYGTRFSPLVVRADQIFRFFVRSASFVPTSPCRLHIFSGTLKPQTLNLIRAPLLGSIILVWESEPKLESFNGTPLLFRPVASPLGRVSASVQVRVELNKNAFVFRLVRRNPFLLHTGHDFQRALEVACPHTRVHQAIQKHFVGLKWLDLVLGPLLNFSPHE